MNQKKGLPSCAGRTRRPLDPRPSTTQNRPCFFCSIPTPAGLFAILILVGHATSAAPFLRADPNFPFEVGAVSSLHRPPPVPVPLSSSRSRTLPRLRLPKRHRLLFFSRKVLDHSGGCPSALSSPRQRGSVADTWLGQLAPGLAVETWSPTAAASPSLHSAPLRLKLLTHPRGASSNPGSASAATAYYCVASPAQHPPEPPTPRPRQTLPSLPRT